MKTLELVIRDGRHITYSAAASVDQDFERSFFEAYRPLYPDSPDDETLFYRIVQGLFGGVLANIRNFQTITPPPLPKIRFDIIGTEVREVDPTDGDEQ